MVRNAWPAAVGDMRTAGGLGAVPALLTAATLWCERCPYPRHMQIQVKDGRVLVGDFTCMDKQGNIILTNTFEHMQLNGR